MSTKILKKAEAEIEEETERQQINQLKNLLRQISELEAALADLYRQKEEFYG